MANETTRQTLQMPPDPIITRKPAVSSTEFRIDLDSRDRRA